MEDFFSNIPYKKIGAGIFIAALVFSGFYKENFLINKVEQDAYNNIKEKTNSRFSGKTVTAIIYFSIAVIALIVGLIFFNN